MISRRVFMKAGTIAVCACAGAVGGIGCGSRPTSDTPMAPEGSYRLAGDHVVLDLPATAALQAVGGAVKLGVDADDETELKLIVLHVAQGDYRAFADRCTHNGKELNYLHDEGQLACCGLSSRFDLEGLVLEPPAEDPLARYAVQRQGDHLLITT